MDRHPRYHPDEPVRLLPDGIYAKLEELTIQDTGLEPAAARTLLDKILGRVSLTASPEADPDTVEHCPIAFLDRDGEWLLCTRGQNGEPHPRDTDGEDLHTSLDARDIREWGADDPRAVNLSTIH